MLINFDDYEIDSDFFDELFAADLTPRESAIRLYDELRETSTEEMDGINERVTRSFKNEGISFTLYDEGDQTERIIPIDCIPRVLPAVDWEELERGLIQRVRALNRFLVDVYGEGKILTDGVIPPDMVIGCPQYRIEMRNVGFPLDVPIGICGTDLIRTQDGFFVLEDNLRVPSGVSYMIANRKAVKTNFPRAYRRHRVREVEHYGRLLYETLVEFAPNQNPDPCIVLLTPGVFNSAFYEHMFLADEIGAELVEGRDLLVNEGFVYMRTTQGLRRVDVIYRRIDDDFLDPLTFRSDSILGVPGLMHAYRSGNVALVNAPGTGVADDKSNYAYVPDIIRYYLSEEPILQNVQTYLCRRPRDLEFTLDNLDKLVVKTVGGSGGYGMLIGPKATPEERTKFAELLRQHPQNYVSQPTLSLSRSPCWIERRPEPRCVDLRPFILTGKRTRLVDGAFCRVAMREGSLVVNSSQGGGAKDFWVTEA